MIERHHQYTNSDYAGRILAEWNFYQEKFIKVTPIEIQEGIAGAQDCRAGTEDRSGGEIINMFHS